jgi:hypothetical protein
MPIQFLSLQGTGGTAVPYERRNAPYYLSSVALNPQDSLRLKRYEEHWRFFQGLQWSFQREDGEPLVTANYCQTIVNKKATWLVGKGMTIGVPEAFRETTKPVLDEVWKYNKKQELLNDMAITGGVTGDAFVLVAYQPPSDAMKAVNPYTEGNIRIRLLGSHQVFPYWNPLNMEELLSVRIITEVADFAPIQPGDDRRTPMTLGSIGVSRKRRYIEDIYPDRIIEGWDGADRTERPNDLGEIPLVHIKNLPFPNEYFGMSDLDGVIDIQREFNEKMTDVSDIVNYHAAPITIITGAKAKNLDRGPKNMWAGFPADAKVFNLELGGDLPASHKYLELVRQVLFDISSIPEGSLGRIQPVSNTSGVALQVQFQPLIEDIERKRPAYESGCERINYFILRIWQLVKRRFFPVDICKNCGGRIVEMEVAGQDGQKYTKRKCYLIDPQTLQFMQADDVKISVVIEHSFGHEVRKMRFGDVKKIWGKKNPSYWDLEPMIDRKEDALAKQQHAEDKQSEQQQQQSAQAKGQAEDAHQRQLELAQAKQKPTMGGSNAS